MKPRSMKQVLLGFTAVTFLSVLLTQMDYPAIITALTARTLYDGETIFHNARSPLASYRIIQTAQLHGFQLKLKLQLDGRYVNPNNTPVVQPALLDEWERKEFENVIMNVHLSMTKTRMMRSWSRYFKSVPFRDAFRLKKSLEREAVLVYYLETFSDESCQKGINMSAITTEHFYAPQFSTPGQDVKLFSKTILISNLNYSQCEHSSITIVHIPRPPEPHIEMSWMDQLKDKLLRLRGKEARPKCHSVARVFKNFKLRRVPDTMISVLFCY